MEAWHEFYLLIGTAGLTLTGLLFVVVSFGARTVATRASIGVRASCLRMRCISPQRLSLPQFSLFQTCHPLWSEFFCVSERLRHSVTWHTPKFIGGGGKTTFRC
jgi:hypothetical protein